MSEFQLAKEKSAMTALEQFTVFKEKLGFNIRLWVTLLAVGSFELFKKKLDEFPPDEKPTRRDVVTACEVYQSVHLMAGERRRTDEGYYKLIADHIIAESRKTQRRSWRHHSYQYYWSELRETVGVSRKDPYELLANDRLRELLRQPPENIWRVWLQCPHGGMHHIATRLFGLEKDGDDAMECWNFNGQLVVRIRFPARPTEPLVYVLGELREHIIVQATNLVVQGATDCFIVTSFSWDPRWNAFITPRDDHHKYGSREFFDAVWSLLKTRGVQVGSLQQWCSHKLCTDVRDASDAEFGVSRSVALLTIG